MAFTMAHYRRNQRAGLCPMCGGKRDADGFYCKHCLALSRVRQSRIPRKWKTVYQRTYREKNRRAGCCPDCGKPLNNGFKRCDSCRRGDHRRKGRLDITKAFAVS